MPQQRISVKGKEVNNPSNVDRRQRSQGDWEGLSSFYELGKKISDHFLSYNC